ncbi:CxxxxCH/CxxCH domain-containing protein [Frankia sp. CH37]|nr:CxxxxCH/CxxCH domain-containing protein [Parafrankia sp. CH37]
MPTRIRGISTSARWGTACSTRCNGCHISTG